MTSTGTRGLRVEGWGGEPVPERFSMARYCLGVAAANRPDAVGLTVVHDVDAPADEAEHHTFAELDLAARAVGAGLRALGLGRGERVLLRLHGTSAFPIAHLGAMSAGLVPVPTSAMLTPDEAGFVLADSGARAVVLADDLQLEVPAGVHVVRPADLDAWVADARRNPAAVPDHVDTAADDPAFLVYTSGTTGRPKGVLHAHRAIWGRRPMHAHWLGLTESDVMLHAGTMLINLKRDRDGDEGVPGHRADHDGGDDERDRTRGGADHRGATAEEGDRDRLRQSMQEQRGAGPGAGIGRPGAS